MTPGPDASVEKLEASIETIADGLMQAGYSDTLHKLPVDSYGEDAQKALAGAPWVSFREEKVN